MFECGNTQTDEQTDGRQLESHPISSPCVHAQDIITLAAQY